MLLAPIALYTVMPVTRLKLGILQRLVYCLVKKLDREVEVVEVEKARAIKLAVKLFIFSSEIQR